MPYQTGVIQIYHLRYYNPRLAGNIYRSKHRCGRSNCKCAKSKKYWHPAYYLEYRQRVDGQWKRKREYIPKNQVRAIRLRIKRAKQKDLEMQNNTRKFLSQMPRLVKRIKSNPLNIAALNGAEKLMNSLKQNPKGHLTKLQIWTIFAQVVDLVFVLTLQIHIK